MNILRILLIFSTCVEFGVIFFRESNAFSHFSLRSVSVYWNRFEDHDGHLVLCTRIHHD